MEEFSGGLHHRTPTIERRMRDSLTGIYNRDGFVRHVNEKVLGEGVENHVMVVMNVRNFKMINYLFGIQKGDEVLKNIAEILYQRACEYDEICSRFHADRFAMFMKRDTWDTYPFEETVAKIESLIDSSVYHLDVIVGVYHIRNTEDSVFDMMDKAILAMKLQRSSSGTSFHFYSENMLNKLKHREEVIAEFDDALKNDEFILFLQPQFTVNGELVGTEALARWNRRNTGEILPPSRFIDVLEATKRIHRLDQYIWELAAKQLHAWKNTKFKDVSISVNISPEDFECISVDTFFIDLVQRYEIDPKQLRIEITENAIISSPVKFENFINNMKEHGFIVELDDFGSGYSSLNVLKNINVDTIKLDMVFVRGLKNDARAQIILESIIHMIHALGMKIIVEGLETRGQLETIQSMGNVVYQGYYFSKPLQVSAFEDKYGEKING